MREHIRRLLNQAVAMARQGQVTEAVSCGEAALFRAADRAELEEIEQWLIDHADVFHQE
jgi:hypothetical protein